MIGPGLFLLAFSPTESVTGATALVPERPTVEFGSPPRERGVALGLFSADPHFRYRSLVDEIVRLGASHVSVNWVWWQRDVYAEAITPIEGWSATEEQILDTMEYAGHKGLLVTAFPIVRLVEQPDGEWRGRIRPKEEDAWWDSYARFILTGADLAQRAGAERFTVGSELLSREPMRGRWLELIDRVRMTAPSVSLMYSANWDHYEVVSFWDAVDVVAVTAYWELGRDLDPTVRSLTLSWQEIRPQILDFSHRLGRPVVFSEVGYPSLDGGTAWPWDETRRAKVDLEEQRRGYEAFIRVWSDTKAIEGVYFWNWFGFGGPDDTGYTPRNKPAAQMIETWFKRPHAF